MHKAVFAALALTSSSAIGLPVMSDSTVPTPMYTDNSGREWLDPLNLLGFNWLEMAKHCSAATGWCTGEAASWIGRSTDLNNYRWATTDEVRSLVYDASGLPEGSLDDYYEYVDDINSYAPSFFANVNDTYGSYVGPPGEYFSVFQALTITTRDVSVGTDDRLYSGFVNITADTSLPGRGPNYASFDLDGRIPINGGDPIFGVLVYKEVPEPGTLALFALGLLGIGVAARRRASE